MIHRMDLRDDQGFSGHGNLNIVDVATVLDSEHYHFQEKDLTPGHYKELKEPATTVLE